MHLSGSQAIKQSSHWLDHSQWAVIKISALSDITNNDSPLCPDGSQQQISTSMMVDWIYVGCSQQLKGHPRLGANKQEAHHGDHYGDHRLYLSKCQCVHACQQELVSTFDIYTKSTGRDMLTAAAGTMSSEYI